VEQCISSERTGVTEWSKFGDAGRGKRQGALAVLNRDFKMEIPVYRAIVLIKLA